MLYELQLEHLWYTKWKGASPCRPQSLHRITCAQHKDINIEQTAIPALLSIRQLFAHDAANHQLIEDKLNTDAITTAGWRKIRLPFGFRI